LDGDGLAGTIGLVVRVQPLRCEGTKGEDLGEIFIKKRGIW